MFLAAVVTALLLFVPGAVVGVAAGLRPMPALAAAGPVAVGVTGFAAWAAGALDVRWGWGPAVVAWAGAAALGYLLHRFLPRANAPADAAGAGLGRPARTRRDSSISRHSPGYRSPWAPSPGEWAVAAVSAAVSVVAAVRYLLPLRELPDGASDLREAWDMHWHYNFLRFASDAGVVSPTRAGELMNRETGNEMFYPAAWHAMGSLVPGDVFVQGNVFGAVAPVLLLPAGAAMLAWVVAGRRWGVVAAATAAVFSILLPEITGSLMVTASLPYLLAVAAIPATTALIVSGRTVAAVPALIGVVLAHPAAGIAVAIFAAFWWITRPRAGSFIRLLVLGAVTAAILWPVLMSASGQGEEVAEFHGQQGLERGQSLWWTVTGMSSHTESIGWYPIPVVLSLIGAVVLLVRRRPWAPWPVPSIVLLGMVSDSAQARWAAPAGDWLQIIGTFFYDMAYRLQAPMGVLRLVLIGVAVSWLVDAVAWAVGKLRGRGGDDRDRPAVPAPVGNAVAYGGSPRRARVATALATATAATVALVPVAWASADEAERTMMASRGDTFVTAADERAMEWLAGQPGADEGHVLVNPSEGSGLMYAREGLPALFTHFPWPEREAKLSETAMIQLDLAGTGVPGDASAVNEADRALRSLGVRYVFVSPPSAGSAGGAALPMRSWAWWSAGLTPVYRDGSATIFAVDDMLTDKQLREVIADSPHPPENPDPALTPRRQPIVATGEPVSPLSGATVALRAGSAPTAEELSDGGGAASSAGASAGTDGTDGTDRTYGTDDADDAGRASGDPAKLSVELMEAVTAELEDRGATVIEIPAGAANSTDSTGSTGATGTAGAGDLSGISADAIIDIGFGKGSGEGFRVTGLYAGDDGTDSPATANLAAGIRDAFVFHGFWPANTFDGPGASAGTIVDGLSPAFGADGATGTPRVVVAPASTGHSDNMAELRGRDGRDRFADSMADGIASMLRQR